MRSFRRFSDNMRNKAFNLIEIFVFCFFIALLFLCVATKSSTLYPFNDWVDTNASFTMGKAMMNGQVLYRDIFDQRGPLLYFIFGLAYLISNTNFLGVFIFEVLYFSVFLYFSLKIFLLFLDIEYGLIALPLLAVSVLNLTSFSHGGSPEELSLPMLTASLYFLLKYFIVEYPKPMPSKWILINGLIAGCVLWIKFSLLGFWFGWMISIFIILLINHGFLQAMKAGLVFMLGMVIATLPWLIYFGFHNAILDWINAYILINITSYTDYSEKISLIPNLKYIPIKFFGHLLLNPFIVGHLYLGFIVFLSNNKFTKQVYMRLGILVCALFLSISVYGFGKSHPYYFLIFSPFLILSFVVLLTFAYQNFGKIESSKLLSIILIIVMASTFSYILLFHHNSYMLEVDQEELVQYNFASIINKTEDATLLNYGELDGGFYTATNITPNVRFFQKQNIEEEKFPLGSEEQNRYIEEKLVEFVVIIMPVSESEKITDIPYLAQNYSLLQNEIQRYEHEVYNYYLFVKR